MTFWLQVDKILDESEVDQLHDASVLVIDPALVSQLNLLYKLRNLKWLQSTWAGLFIQQYTFK